MMFLFCTATLNSSLSRPLPADVAWLKLHGMTRKSVAPPYPAPLLAVAGITLEEISPIFSLLFSNFFSLLSIKARY